MEKANRQLQARLDQLESEIRRLRALNEKISLTSVGDNKSPSPNHMSTDGRPLSPPPEGSQLASVGQDQSHEDSSPSPTDEGY